MKTLFYGLWHRKWIAAPLHVISFYFAENRHKNKLKEGLTKINFFTNAIHLRLMYFF